MVEVWSIATASGLHSALAGVFGGVAFTAIVLFMQADESRKAIQEAQGLVQSGGGDASGSSSPTKIRLSYVHGLRHLIVAFFAFVVTALLFGITAGYEGPLLLPMIITVPTTASFAVAVVELAVALTWMTGRFSVLALPTARKASRWMAGMAALFLADTAGDLGARLGAQWFDIGMSVFGVAAGGFLAWKLPPKGMIDPKTMSTRNHLARAMCAATLIIAVILFSLVTLLPDGSALVDGDNIGTWQVWLVLSASFLGTLWACAALGALMLGLPAPNSEDTPKLEDDYRDPMSWGIWGLIRVPKVKEQSEGSTEA